MTGRRASATIPPSRIPSHESVLFQNVSAIISPTRDLVVYAAVRHNTTELEFQPVEHLTITAAIGCGS